MPITSLIRSDASGQRKSSNLTVAYMLFRRINERISETLTFLKDNVTKHKFIELTLQQIRLPPNPKLCILPYDDFFFLLQEDSNNLGNKIHNSQQVLQEQGKKSLQTI